MMKYRKFITLMVMSLVVLSSIAALSGILSSDGSGPFMHETVRGEIIEIYGNGKNSKLKFINWIKKCACIWFWFWLTWEGFLKRFCRTCYPCKRLDPS